MVYSSEQAAGPGCSWCCKSQISSKYVELSNHVVDAFSKCVARLEQIGALKASEVHAKEIVGYAFIFFFIQKKFPFCKFVFAAVRHGTSWNHLFLTHSSKWWLGKLKVANCWLWIFVHSSISINESNNWIFVFLFNSDFIIIFRAFGWFVLERHY
jgi:hypothetical protein